MRVLVAMSGGVDSSMAAALLAEEGHEVTGVHLKMADTPSGLPGKGCCTLDDARDARRVADRLDIPFYVWNMAEAFHDRVVENFVAEYAEGRTPNPCVRCNERVKYRALLERALDAGFDALATGHHVRLREEDGRWRMLRPADAAKDQTYVLYMATQAQLAHTLWPVGEYRKATLREMARERGLVTAGKPDSYDICFIPSGDIDHFLRPRLGERPGVFVGPGGEELGTHDGAYRYTIGQRRGLGLGGHPAPQYVTKIDGNRVHVGPKEALQTAVLEASGTTWASGSFPSQTALRAQVRYQGEALPAVVEPLGADRIKVRFPGLCPTGVAPGQAVVLYHGDECLGGATILSDGAVPARVVNSGFGTAIG